MYKSRSAAWPCVYCCFFVFIEDNIVMPHRGAQTRQLVSLYGKINNTLMYSTSHGTMYTSLYTYINIYADGMQDSSLTNTGRPFSDTTSEQLMLTIMQYNETMAGEYTIVIKLHCSYSVFHTLLPGCGFDYYDKICYSFSLLVDNLLDLVKEVSITTFGGFIVIIISILIL